MARLQSRPPFTPLWFFFEIIVDMLQGEDKEFLSDVSFEALVESPYLKSALLTFTLNGVERRWELAMRHASVAILLFHSQKQQFLTVRQFRPAIFVGETKRRAEFRGKDYNDIPWSTLPLSHGMSLELCAGIIDKPGLSVAEIAKEEVEEECGYVVGVDQLQHVATYFGGVNESGAPQHLFYAQIDESQAAPHGGGGNLNDGEFIDKVWIGLDEARTLLNSHDYCVPGGLLFAFHWWFHRREILKVSPATSAPNSLDASPITFDHRFGRIENLRLGENVDKSRWQPVRMRFTRRGQKRTWDMSPANDTVAVLTKHRSSGKILLVHRLRPAMLMGRLKHAEENRGKTIVELPIDNAPTSLAVTLELVDGNFPVQEGAEAAAHRVVGDKLGFDILHLQLIAYVTAGVSQGGNRGHIFYAEVDGESRLTKETTPWDVETVSFCHHLNDVFLKESEADAVLASAFLPAPPTLLFALAWYKANV